MHPLTVIHVISYIVLFLSAAELASAGVSFLLDDAHIARRLLGAAVITGISGGFLWIATRGRHQLKRRDGYAVVTFGWLTVALFGTLPYLLTGSIESPAAAFFESMSGFTATGATVLTDLDAQPRGVLFFRAISQWIGGMGVLVLVVAILPFLGVGAATLFKAEIPGPSADRLTPQIANTAKILWFLYLGLTAACAVALALAGMTWFEAVCHAFTCLATGGFSTHPHSIEGFDSLPIEMIVLAFMVLGGLNFSLHFRFLQRRWGAYLRNEEVRVMFGILAVAIAVVSVSLWRDAGNGIDTLGQGLRAASFQCVAIMTTTGYGGYGTQAFADWTPTAKLVLVGLMLCGACAGSTSGSAKVVRVIVCIKNAHRMVKQHLVPKAIYRVKLDGRSLPEEAVNRATAFFIIFLFGMIAGGVVMTFFTGDLVTAMSASVACLANIGPGLGSVGPAGHFNDVEPLGQVFLAGLMLLGRLELFTFLVLFTLPFWKR